MAEEGGRWLTGLQAAARCHVSRSGLRSLVQRAAEGGVDVRAPRAVWPDQRTPLYDAQLVEEYLQRRPGRGRRSAS